jgi:protocatechuate 3,4-dioxygenase beta subunit
VVRPELTEGPYYVDEGLQRSDIRSDPSDGSIRPGALLALTFNVSSAASNACSPLEGAIVDVWHCDALGVYSDVSDPGFNTSGQRFLRGYQVTGSDGVARFTTIYPGWYQGRAVHIHFKIRSSASASSAYEFTSQLFFDDSLTDLVHATEPYASKGQRTLRNSGDGIYRGGGAQLVLDVAGSAAGYSATFNIALESI